MERVLDSVLRQSQIPNQIILAHDTIDATIQEVIDKFTPQLIITYINQEDTGFNKNRILNKAILAANNDRIIFIDGHGSLMFIDEPVKQFYENLNS